MAARTARRNQQCLAAKLDGILRAGQRTFEVDERYVAGSQKASVHRAECAHHADVRLCDAVAQIKVTGLIQVEIAQTPGREDQLTGETQLIERARTIVATKRTESLVILAQ